MSKSCFSFKDLCVCVEADDKNIIKISFVDKVTDDLISNELLDDAKTQMIEYLSGKRKCFELPYKSEDDNTFRGSVYNIVSKIPYGEVMTYKQVAIALGEAKKARAVGQALNKNKLLVLMPCHRVIKSDGSTGGFAYGHDLKKRLLDIEAKNK